MSNIQTALPENRRNAVSQFLSWWTRELAEMLSALFSKHSDWRVLLLKTDKGLDVFVRQSGSINQIGTLDADTTEDQIQLLRTTCQRQQAGPASTILRLSQASVLQKDLSLPRGTEDVLEPVLRNQMERIAPWPEAETRFGYEILNQDDVSDQLDLRVVITSTDILEETLAQAKRIGVAPGIIDVGASAVSKSNIKLIETDTNGPLKIQRRVGLLFGVLLALALAIGGFGLWDMLSQQQVLNALDQKISVANKRGKLLRALATNNTELRQRRLRLVKRKQNTAPVIVMMEMLSRVLPDTAWLTRLEIQNNQMQFFGRAANAAALITTLESSPYFTNVQFSAPTTRRPNTKFEIFSIKARAALSELPKQ